MRTLVAADGMCRLWRKAGVHRAVIASLATLAAVVSLVAVAAVVAQSSDPAPAAQTPVTHMATYEHPSRRMIGATATVTEASSGLPFRARVDTGATTCSIHYEALEIRDPAPEPQANIGKPVRILIKNKRGQSTWVEARIAGYSRIRNADWEEDRYKVRIGLRWRDFEKKVLVTLNDRGHMTYPVLIGRNFLRDDFLVNVNLGEGQ